MITLITGGHRAGKTTMALKLASSYPSKSYIATAEPIDEEMAAKIKKHQAERDSSYTTIEETLALGKAIQEASGDIIIIDCLTMWVNNLLYYKQDAEQGINELCETIRSTDKKIIMITNESSFCIIPGDKESRQYLNILAETNRKAAAVADNVCLMISGIPTWIKGRELC